MTELRVVSPAINRRAGAFMFPLKDTIPSHSPPLMLWTRQVLSGVVSVAGPEQVGGIAWWAHIGGFVAGAVLLGVFVRPERPYQADEYGIERAFMRR